MSKQSDKIQAKMKRKEYEKELRKLQVELCALQDWVKHHGLRAVVSCEGRDAAGKGGTIKAITGRVSPRVFRVVALPTPSDREKAEIYFQRYLSHFPTAGEIVIFDRSWYNRAGVEYVMGFCTNVQHRRFLQAQRLWHRQALHSGGNRILRVATAGDQSTNLCSDPGLVHALTHSLDLTGDFQPRYVGNAGRWGISALALQDVRPVDTGGRNTNQHLAGPRSRSRALHGAQHLRRARLANLDRGHHGWHFRPNVAVRPHAPSTAA